jgi:hypothetical protein
MDALDSKLNEVYAGKVVRKDLLHQIKKGTNVPSFVLEFLLTRKLSPAAPMVLPLDRSRCLLRKQLPRYGWESRSLPGFFVCQPHGFPDFPGTSPSEVTVLFLLKCPTSRTPQPRRQPVVQNRARSVRVAFCILFAAPILGADRRRPGR